MEGVVVLAIFSILAVSFSEIYVRTSKGSMQTAERARVQADARTMLESIARAARVSNIDYVVYGGTLPSMANPATELDLTDPDANISYRIKSNATDSTASIGSPRITIPFFSMYLSSLPGIFLLYFAY